jgi:hypothetical protein
MKKLTDRILALETRRGNAAATDRHDWSILTDAELEFIERALIKLIEASPGSTSTVEDAISTLGEEVTIRLAEILKSCRKADLVE